MITEFAKLTGVTELEILGKHGCRRVMDVRQMYWYMLTVNGFGYTEIARLCDRNHATIISGKRRIRALIEIGDPVISHLYELTRNIKRYV